MRIKIAPKLENPFIQAIILIYLIIIFLRLMLIYHILYLN